MSLKKKNSSSSIIERINLSEDYEVEYWSNKFGVNAKSLQSAVRHAGDNATDVEEFLKKNAKQKIKKQ